MTLFRSRRDVPIGKGFSACRSCSKRLKSPSLQRSMDPLSVPDVIWHACAIFEASAAAQALCHMTADHAEAVNAFLEKRPPQFTGA